MRVHLHTLCWNDRGGLDYFFRHYRPWVDRFYILDDGSDDGTREYLGAQPDVVLGRLHHVEPQSWVLSAKHIYDTDWKRSRGEADWVVVANIDEHLHHPDMPAYLQDALRRGVTVIPALGYQMMVDDPPPDGVLWRDRPMGAPWANMSKAQIFRPDSLSATNFAVGRHLMDPQGTIRLPERDDVANLHYKFLGGIAALHRRHQQQAGRLGPVDRANRWGHEYDWPLAKLETHFAAFRSNLVDTSAVDHHATHPARRWWRAPDWPRQVQRKPTASPVKAKDDA